MSQHNTDHLKDEFMRRAGMAEGGSVAHFAIGGQEKSRNWLKGSVENVLDPLKQRQNLVSPDLIAGMEEDANNPQSPRRERSASRLREHKHGEAINKWIESNLANYIRRHMATHDDPIRKLAEEGIIHMPSEQVGMNRYQARRVREKMGHPQLGKSEAAQAWEDAADVSMMPYKIKDLDKLSHRPNVQREPWMDKADPETQVFMPLDNMHAHYLGFDHLVDILKEDLAEGRIRPEQLSKISIEHAVRRAHDYDQEKKRKMAETALKATEGMPVHAEYPEGYKWLELAMPKELPEGWQEMEGHKGIYIDPEGKNTIHNPNKLRLEEALKYEGDTMGHCVGSYCSDVASGKKRIYSLRDAKNEPHVTIEVNPHVSTSHDLPQEIADKWNNKMQYPELAKYKFLNDYLSAEHPELHAKMNEPRPPHIRQIKGKQNQKPKKEYIKYVQDFIKRGKWSSIQDLQNSEMRDVGGKYFTDPELDELTRKHFGTVINNPSAYYRDMARRHPDTITDADKGFLEAVKRHGEDHMAEGGTVAVQEAKAKPDQLKQEFMQRADMAKGGSAKQPKKTVKAYKMFRVDPKRPGQLFPLFVDADTPVPMNQWVDAIEGAMANGKVKSKIGPLAYRPGWHAGDLPLATHIGDKDEEQKAEVARIQALRQAMLADIGDDKEGKKIVNKMYPYPSWVNAPRLRNPRHIWAEIEMPHDVDWQSEAERRGYNDEGKFVANRAHITDQLPKGGHYRYKTNANMTGNWLIGGSMKVNKILHDAEVQAINEAAGAADLPRLKPMNKEKFGFDKGGSVPHAAPDEWIAEELANYRDPKSTKISDWKWRKMKYVRKDMPIIEIPDYIQQQYGEFMNDQHKRAKAGELTPRDLLKAFTITQSSIGRGGLPHSTATKTGMKLPNTGGEVRPEGAFAEWLGSPMGQRFLDLAEHGQIDPKVLKDIQEKFSPFGKQNQLTDQMTYAAQTIPSLAKSMNKAVTGSTDEYRDWAEQMKGIAGAKSGFVGSMIGRGDLPTLDARQLNLHALPANVGISSIMNRGKGKGAREAVDRLIARQKAMNLKIDPSLAQHYQHLAHHAVWDAAGNNKTTHADIIKAMRGYDNGGTVAAQEAKAKLDQLKQEFKQLAERDRRAQQAAWNAEQMAKPTGKKKGGNVSTDSMRYALTMKQGKKHG